MSLNTVLAAALATLPLAFFSPAQAEGGEGNGPALDASNYGSWTFVQDSAAPTNLQAEAYVSQGRFTEMVPDVVVANLGAETPVPAGKALSVYSMTTRGNVAYARAATGKRPGG